jgi:predicted methyltransferase
MKKLILAAAGGMAILCSGVPWAHTIDQPAVEEAMARPGRLESDISRDQRSRPEVVIPMLGLGKGARVADIFGGSGYYSELLAGMVGPEGEVLLHNNKAYKGFVGEALEIRMARKSAGNITLHDREVDDLGLGKGDLDAALIIMSYHDLYHADPESGWAAIDSDDFLGQVFRALKPGGRFLIVDHQAKSGSGNSAAQDLHRIEQGFAVQDIEGAGFRLYGASSALRNSSDDHSLMVFDENIRGKTDRFILVFEKP